ncbi:hypothetical protein [Loktanella sp. S4079]|uniref:hypothetical protein n=1 Tax=Loktanella sp. S4079 TaxID=579483 RepID=UPI0005F9D7D2|nr:hypothetical protein [Loktanella sp. S4079]KJZ20284.1 hypothetical protein TW80_05555 [Loktanella sp. S4079]
MYKNALFVSIGLALCALPNQSLAQCRIAVAGTNCVAVPRSTAPRPSPVEIGSFLERGEHSILMNASYYGLPPVQDGWVYIRIEDDLFRVDFSTYEVLERVTYMVNHHWR